MSFCFETGSYNVALELEDQAALELTEICLSLLFKCWIKDVCHHAYIMPVS